eukprot:8365000-Pyramimonas_sp.AAC.2
MITPPPLTEVGRGNVRGWEFDVEGSATAASVITPPLLPGRRRLVSHLRHTCGTLAAHLRHTCVTLVSHLRHTCVTVASHL